MQNETKNDRPFPVRDNRTENGKTSDDYDKAGNDDRNDDFYLVDDISGGDDECYIYENFIKK